MKEVILKSISALNLDFRSLNHRLKDISNRHMEVSAILSDNYKYSKPTKRLFDIFSQLIIHSQNQHYNLFRERKNIPEYVYDFPGEHYPVLQALVEIINAKKIVEIGTYTGLSSIAFFHVMNIERKLTSVDIVPWKDFKNSFLIDKDFDDYNITQIIADFKNIEDVEKHSKLLQEADLIFCDGPKDKVFEKQFLLNLEKIKIKDGCIIFLDNIKQWNMLQIWNDIKMPKLDITSIGHFTGSGLIEWDSKISCF